MEDNLEISKKLQKRDNVLNLKYINILRLLLSCVGAWPGEELGQKTHWLSKFFRFYLPFQCTWVWIGEIYYMANNNLDFMAFGDVILGFLLTTLLLVRLSLPMRKEYGKVTRDFIQDVHLMHFKHKGIHFKKVNEIVHKVSVYFTFYILITSFYGSVLYNAVPLYINYKAGAFSQDRKENGTDCYSALYYSYPFFNPLQNPKTLTVLNYYSSTVFVIDLCIMDSLLLIMVFHIIGHIVILERNLESITGPEKEEYLIFNGKKLSVRVFSEEENRKIGLILKDCVNHHRFIVRFIYNMSDFFGFVLAANYVFQLVGCCILLLETTQGDLNAVIRFGPLSLIIFGQLIQISVIFEIVGTVSEKLPETLYCIPWECLDIRNQRSVCILLHQLQRPINVTAMGMTTVGVTTMARILKTTFSYFAFLRSLK